MYVFNASDTSFYVLMLRSDWTRFHAVMKWFLWNHFTLRKNMLGMMPNMPACAALLWNVEKTYGSTETAVKQQKVDSKVGYS